MALSDLDVRNFPFDVAYNSRLNLEFLWPKKNRLNWQIKILLKRRSYDLIVRNPFR